MERLSDGWGHATVLDEVSSWRLCAAHTTSPTLRAETTAVQIFTLQKPRLQPQLPRKSEGVPLLSDAL